MPSNERRKNGFWVIILLLATLAPHLGAEDRIEWAAVEGADHYSVEITQDGALILRTQSDQPWLPLFLPPGDYLFKVQAISPFGKVATESEPSPLRIIAPAIPFIIDLLPGEIYDGSDPAFIARVSGYVAPNASSEGSIFVLEDQDGKTIDLTIDPTAFLETVENGTDTAEDAAASSGGNRWDDIHLSTGRKKPDSGPWALIMTNPDGRENRMDGALNVKKSSRPRVRGVSPRSMEAGNVHTPIKVEISGMEEGADVIIDGPSPVMATLLNTPKQGVLEYSLNLESVGTGWYSVSVRNPSGGEDYLEKAFQVLPRPLSEEELEEAYALKIDERPARALKDHPHSLFFGWNFSIPIGDTDGTYTADYVGLSLGYSQDFHNDFFRKVPGLNGLGWDVTFRYARTGTTYPLLPVDLNTFSFLLGLHYVTTFDFFMNLILRASQGIAFSVYSSPDADRSEDIGGFTLQDLDSLDYTMSFGAGIRFDIGTRWYVDALCDFSATFYLSRSVWTVQPRIEGGWRW